MKKLTVAISAVAASVLMAMSAQAAEIYNKDCIDSLEVRKKPGGHWIIRYLAGLDLVGLASL